MIKRTFTKVGTSTLATIYTVPQGARTELKMLWISNISGSNSTISITYYNAVENATISLFDGYALSSKTFFTVGGEAHEFLVMGENDYIQVSSTHSCTFLISLIEYDNQFKNL
jgi:hypothetical protein